MNNFALVIELLNIGGIPVGQVLTRAVVYHGDSFKLKCWARDLAGRVINLTNYTPTVAVGQSPLTVTPVNNAAGEFEIDVAGGAIAAGTHDMKCTFTHSGGAITKVLCPKFIEVKEL